MPIGDIIAAILVRIEAAMRQREADAPVERGRK